MLRADVEYNFAKWLRLGFGSAGRVRVRQEPFSWIVDCLVEGPPAHDPDYVEMVGHKFREFVLKGWGPLAIGRATVKIMAGDVQDGRPRAQMIELASSF